MRKHTCTNAQMHTCTHTRKHTHAQAHACMHAPTLEIAVPTEEPSYVPSHSPTTQPTAMPTWLPSAVSSAVPTVVPTGEPSHAGTIAPTWLPVPSPTEIPTWEPTHTPTDRPSLIPTAIPTEHPTRGPTLTPTDPPSDHKGVDHAVTPVPQLQALKPQTEQPSPGTSKASGVVANVPSKTANCAAGYHSVDRRLCSTSFGAMRVTLGGSIEQFTAAHLREIKKDLSALWQIPSASIHLHAEAGSFVLEVVVDKEGLHGCELVKQFQSKWARYRETSLQKARRLLAYTPLATNTQARSLHRATLYGNGDGDGDGDGDGEAGATAHKYHMVTDRSAARRRFGRLDHSASYWSRRCATTLPSLCHLRRRHLQPEAPHPHHRQRR